MQEAAAGRGRRAPWPGAGRGTVILLRIGLLRTGRRRARSLRIGARIVIAARRRRRALAAAEQRAAQIAEKAAFLLLWRILALDLRFEILNALRRGFEGLLLDEDGLGQDVRRVRLHAD